MLEQEIKPPHQLESKAATIGAFSLAACQYRAAVKILYDGKCVNAKSILGLLSLGISPNTSFMLRVEGEDEELALNQLCGLLKKESSHQ